jgi:signal transduction histidine kinase
MLDDFEDTWNEVDSRQRYINYTNLPPGEYDLLVSATNSEGTWSEDPTSLSVTVLPPFWKTILFDLVIVALVLIIFLAILRVRTRMLQNQKKILEKEVEERTHDLKESNKLLEDQKNETKVISDKLHESDQMKLKFFTNISHEFRTPLTLIMGPTEKLIKQDGYEDRSKVKQELELIYRNEKRLFKLINQLLEIRKVETGNLELSVSEDDIVGYLRQIHQLFKPYAEQKSIDFQFQSGSTELRVYFDADKIEKIFYNLLSNAFKHTPEYGSIIMTVFIDDSQDNQRL